jgi:predicted RNA-binding protein YlqC (UPF0109 family)
MKEFLEFLIKGICEKPEEVEVKEVTDEGVFIYEVKVADEDMGVVIGKSGKTIRSLRNLAKAKAIKDNVRIQIVLEESPEHGHETPEDEEDSEIEE